MWDEGDSMGEIGIRDPHRRVERQLRLVEWITTVIRLSLN
jgi:hypothetical protein